MLDNLIEGIINISNFLEDNMHWFGLSLVVLLLIGPIINLVINSINSISSIKDTKQFKG